MNFWYFISSTRFDKLRHKTTSHFVVSKWFDHQCHRWVTSARCTSAHNISAILISYIPSSIYHGSWSEASRPEDHWNSWSNQTVWIVLYQPVYPSFLCFKWGYSKPLISIWLCLWPWVYHDIMVQESTKAYTWQAHIIVFTLVLVPVTLSQSSN